MTETVKVTRLCSDDSCNKDFELEMYNAGPDKLASNHQECPHCGARNDIWVMLEIISPG